MKKFLSVFALISGLVFFNACSDDDDNNPGVTNAKIRYNFVADSASNYQVSYFLDTANANPSGSEILNNGTTFDKTVTAPTGKVTKLLVLPPQNWQLGMSSPAILQIYVNDVLKVSDTTNITATDLPGSFVITPY